MLYSPLVVASHNQGKVREIADLLAPLGLDVRSATALGLPEPDETGQTFEENAELKARAAHAACGMATLADDSGIVVPALNDAPGIFSARWAGPGKDFSVAMGRVARELHNAGVEPSGAAAYFVCTLAVSDRAGTLTTVRGEVHGTLTFPPRGEKGFGYDPIFVPNGYTQTFGEMDAAEKYRISHRTRAFAALLDLLQKKDA